MDSNEIIRERPVPQGLPAGCGLLVRPDGPRRVFEAETLMKDKARLRARLVPAQMPAMQVYLMTR